MTSTATMARGLSARDGVTLPVALVALASLVLATLARAEPVTVPATTWPVLVAMAGAAAFLVAAVRALGPGWPDLRRLLVFLTVIAAAYPGLWALAVIMTGRSPDSTAAWVAAVLAGVAHLPLLGAFSVVPLLSVRYLGPGTGRSLLAGVLALGVAAATSFALFFDDFEPLAASALAPSPVGERVGTAVNLAFLATVLLGPAVALFATWRNAQDVAAARRLAMVAGSALAGTLLVMVCGALGEASALGAAVLLVGMYAALTLVVTGCVRALGTDLAEPRNPPPDEPVDQLVDAPVDRPGGEVAPGPDAPSSEEREGAGSSPDGPDVGLEALTRRENEVLQLLAEGLSNAGIAARLVLSERTVDAHLRSVFVKLDLPQGPEHNRRVQAGNTYRDRAATVGTPRTTSSA
jgi:DNA-binding CsgD family transcriptional regulator